MKNRKNPGILAALFLLVTLSPIAAKAEPSPEPHSVAGICNKRVGGWYAPRYGHWVINPTQVAAKNQCVWEMTYSGARAQMR